MTEHWYLMTMLAVVALETAFVGVLTYKALRMSQRIEALTAATYLEARKALGQSR